MATPSARKAGWGRGMPQQQQQKENNNGMETPVEKKRKVTGKELGSEGVKLRTHRRAFASMINMRLESSSSSSPAGKTVLQGEAAAVAGVGDGGMSTSASDVEALLGMKMMGKPKFDFKVSFLKLSFCALDVFLEMVAFRRIEEEIGRAHGEEENTEVHRFVLWALGMIRARVNR